MWADQVSSTDDLTLPISGTGVKKEMEMSGYIVQSEETQQEEPQGTAETLDPVIFPVALVGEPADVTNADEGEMVKLDVPTVATASEEGSLPHPEPVENLDTSNTVPIISPTPVSLQPSVFVPVQFPTTSETPQPEIRRSDSPFGFTPAVTFEANLNSRTETPDPDAEPKRKRISSQNFQRLARRISLSTRRQSSVSSIIPNIPGFKRSDSPRISMDDNARAESSTSNDSPAGSVKGDDKGKSKKKDKKDKKAAS